MVVALALAGLSAGAALAPAHGAGVQRYANALTPLLDAAGGKPIGSLGPGAAVDVIGQAGAATEVAVHGWSAASAPGTVFAAPGQAIQAVSGFAGQAAPGATQTVGGATYTAVTVQGWVPTAALADDVQTVWTSASDLYAKSCSSCHALSQPTAYTAAQWPGIMATQADNAGLDEGQAALITAYLQAHAAP
ncbi:MAG: hypothetical protein WDM92_00530 [Caulobacteraceae bacterium]